MQKLSLVACKHRLTKSPNHRITNYSGYAFVILVPLGITQTGPFDKLRDRLVSAFAPHKLYSGFAFMILLPLGNA
jgi:hypothetical protein